MDQNSPIQNSHTNSVVTSTSDALFNAHEGTTEEAANEAGPSPIQQIMLMDKIDLDVFLQSRASGGYKRCKLPDTIASYSHAASLYLYPNGTIRVGQSNGPLMSNGGILCRKDQGVHPARLPKRDPHSNELTLPQKKELFRRSDGEPAWKYQTGILVQHLLLILNYAKEQFGNDTIIKRLALKWQEFYLEYPIPANAEEFFHSTVRIIARHYPGAVQIKSNKQGSWLEAAFELDNRINGRKICKFLRLKFYRKKNSFRLEVQFIGIKPRDTCEPNVLLNYANRLAAIAAKILDPIHNDISSGIVVPRIDPSELWKALDKFKFKKAMIRRDFETFVEQLSYFGTYTPTVLTKKELRLSRWILETLTDPVSGILTKIVLPNKRVTYLLRPDWHRVLLSAAQNINQGGESKGNQNENS